MKQVMHNAIACYPVADAQPVPKQWFPCLPTNSQVYILSMTLDSMEYPFGQLGPAVMAILPPSFFCTSLLAEGGKLKSPWLSISTA